VKLLTEHFLSEATGFETSALFENLAIVSEKLKVSESVARFGRHGLSEKGWACYFVSESFCYQPTQQLAIFLSGTAFSENKSMNILPLIRQKVLIVRRYRSQFGSGDCLTQ
jgi:ubiquitin C-terminal hydrolase